MDFLSAEYNEWELDFELPFEVTKAIYLSLNRGLAAIPTHFFMQRPMMHEQVRLVWETLVARSPRPLWMWELGRTWCPSAPTESLHNWLIQPENEEVHNLLLQALYPTDMYPAEWNDAELRSVWLLAESKHSTTQKLLVEAGSEAETRANRRIATTTRLPNPGTMQPPMLVPIDDERKERFSNEAAMGFFSCFWNEGDSSSLSIWLEDTDPCAVHSLCTLLWIMRGCLFMQVFVCLVSALPSCMAFISPGRAEGPTCQHSSRAQILLGLALCSSSCVALSTSGFAEFPEDSASGLNGPGFICEVFVLVLGIGSCCFVVLSKQASTSDEVVVIQGASKAQASSQCVGQAWGGVVEPPKVLTNQRDMPPRPSVVASFGYVDDDDLLPESSPPPLALSWASQDSNYRVTRTGSLMSATSRPSVLSQVAIHPDVVHRSPSPPLSSSAPSCLRQTSKAAMQA